MTVSSGSAPTALTRLTVTSSSRRADLALPAGLPLIELVPDLARDLGILDAGHAAHGYRVLTSSGTRLDLDRSLISQGVTDGDVLTIEPAGGADEKVYDDVVEAVADLVESQFAPWTPAHSSATALAASTVMFLAAGYALLTARGPLHITVVCAAITVLLLLTAGVLGPARGQHRAAAAVSATAAVFAAITAFAAQPEQPLWGAGLLAAGAGIAVAALIGAALSGPYRPHLVALALIGVGLVALGGAPVLFEVSRTSVAAVLIVIVTVLGNVLPWLAVTTGRLTPNAPLSDADIFGEVPVIEADQVRRQVLDGQAFIVALALSSGVLMVASVPDLVQAGVWGTALVVCALAVTVLRTRHTRTRSTVLIAMLSTVAGLALTAVVASHAHPSWRPTIALGLAVTAAVTVALALLVPRTRLRMGRLADALEGVVLIALIPLAARTIGLI